MFNVLWPPSQNITGNSYSKTGLQLPPSDARKSIRVHVDSDGKGVDEMATPGGSLKTQGKNYEKSLENAW